LHNEAALLRPVTALLVKTGDRWETGRKYMTVKEINPTSRIYGRKVA